MIFLKQILSLRSMIGVLLTLITFNISSAPKKKALRVSDIRLLGKQFYSENNLFLSYIFNLSFYNLTQDSTEKMKAGIDALKSCMVSHHFQEAAKIINKLSADFPYQNKRLKYLYGYLLLSAGNFTMGDFYIRELEDCDSLQAQVQFLRAYAKMNMNQPDKCLEYLEKIDKKNFPSADYLDTIKNFLKEGPKGHPKYKPVAMLLSLILPGAGQAYAGFYFDAIQSFGFNLALGCGTFAAWQNELNHPAQNRNYAMPIITTSFFAIFYITNLYNTANVSEKANLYRENMYYQKILSKFHVVLRNKKYFLNYAIDF